MPSDTLREAQLEGRKLDNADKMKDSPRTEEDTNSTRPSSRNDSSETAPPTEEPTPPMHHEMHLVHQQHLVPLAPVAPVTLGLCGWALQLLIAPGDIFVVPGSGRLGAIGTAGGFMGHVILVLQPPICIRRCSEESHDFADIWAWVQSTTGSQVEELWKIRTIESTRSSEGLCQTDAIFFVDPKTLRLTFCGELTLEEDGSPGELNTAEKEPVEIWQSPCDLRGVLRVDLMMECVQQMVDHQADWSEMTAIRAVFKSARVSTSDNHQSLPKIQKYWKERPICTSVAIIFWQRYLCRLIEHRVAETRELFNEEPDANQVAVDQWNLIIRWMPLKADRVLPGDLTSVLREVGWSNISTVPRIFQPLQLQFAHPQVLLVEQPPQMPGGDLEPAERVDAEQDTQGEGRRGPAFRGPDIQSEHHDLTDPPDLIDMSSESFRSEPEREPKSRSASINNL